MEKENMGGGIPEMPQQESKIETKEELKRELKNLERRIETKYKQLREWEQDPEALQPLSSVPGIIELIQQNIAEMENKRVELASKLEQS